MRNLNKYKEHIFPFEILHKEILQRSHKKADSTVLLSRIQIQTLLSPPLCREKNSKTFFSNEFLFKLFIVALGSSENYDLYAPTSTVKNE